MPDLIYSICSTNTLTPHRMSTIIAVAAHSRGNVPILGIIPTGLEKGSISSRISTGHTGLLQTLGKSHRRRKKAPANAEARNNSTVCTASVMSLLPKALATVVRIDFLFLAGLLSAARRSSACFLAKTSSLLSGHEVTLSEVRSCATTESELLVWRPSAGSSNRQSGTRRPLERHARKLDRCPRCLSSSYNVSFLITFSAGTNVYFMVLVGASLPCSRQTLFRFKRTRC